MKRTATLPLFEDVKESGGAAESRTAKGNARSVMKTARSGSFTDNLKLPIHRWFRYSAGFSAEWAEHVIREHMQIAPVCILDPFAGSGTTLLAAEKAGVKAVGFESHPFVARIAKAKLMWPNVNPSELIEACADLIGRTRAKGNRKESPEPALLQKCFSEDTLLALVTLRDEFLESPPSDPAVRELLWLGLTAILRACSDVGTAQWQYVLPNKKKAKSADPYIALDAKIAGFVSDIEYAVEEEFRRDAEIVQHDARIPSELPRSSVDLIVTSPPYANNYDYADATRLEMTFWREISSWGDLQGTVRKYIVRSCSQHSAADRLELDTLLAMDTVAPIIDELAPVCRDLEKVRLTKGGKKTYHTMVAAYFADLSSVFRNLRPICKPGSRICFVVGDSAPYGVYVPADYWLGKLAVAAGFRSFSFEKLRDRNTKWKNRKHRVPLHEGRLWIEG